ncbi:recombinase family protein [Clostridium perfringens]|uniref:recombinase family protein n=3 Tax=Clostridium perfringens TaxID=1502 RepID=UPI0039ECC7D9
MSKLSVKNEGRKVMIYGYARVSTKGQAKEGNGLESQKKEILKKYENAKIYEESYTGTKTDRPVFNKVLDQLQEGDTLVVAKLDRLARNTIEGIRIVEDLFAKGVAVHVLNVGLLENTTMGKFFLTTMLAVAEMERNTIIERTQAGKEIAKSKEGFKEGRPKAYSKDQLDNALSMLSINGGDKSYKEVERLIGISKSTLIREMRKRKQMEEEK